MKNYTTKEVNGLLDELMDSISNNITGGTKTWDEVKIQFKKDKGLILTLPEIGKWYTDNDEDGMFDVYHLTELKQGRVIYYGICGGFWRDSEWMSTEYVREDCRLATQDEILTALTKEAEKRGLVEGAKVTREGFETNKNSVVIEENNGNEGFHMWDGYLFFGRTQLTENGKWATIIDKPTEMTIAQIESKHGYTNLKIIAE